MYPRYPAKTSRVIAEMKNVICYQVVRAKMLAAFLALGFLACGGSANAQMTLYSYHVQSPWCADTYDVVNINVTISVDSSTPDGSYGYRINRINQSQSNLDLYCRFSVQNGLITDVCDGSHPNAPYFTFVGQLSAGSTGGGLRVYDIDNWAHKAEFPVAEGGQIFVGYDCPPPAGAVYSGAMILHFGSQLGSYTKPCDAKNGGDQCNDCGSHAMARYSAHSMLASLNVEDTPITYTPPRGPAIKFTVTYNQRDTQEPQTLSSSNLGPKWTFNWLSCVIDDPATQLSRTLVYVPGGGAESYAFDPGTQSFSSDPQSHATLVRISSSTYEKRFPDGSKQIFSQSNGASSYPRQIFITQWIDSAGNSVAINYDGSNRITSVTDALEQSTTFSYELPGDSLKITKVTDPFGRYAVLNYTNGKLTSITDPIGIQSVFTYATDGTNFITSLQTPYGTTNFATGQLGTNRWVEMTDPLGGKERVEYRDNAPGISAIDPAGTVPAGFTNSGLDVANTFYWDKKAMSVAPGDYTKAKIIHWLYNSDGSVSGIASSEKAPLENRVWYKYAGQSDYLHVGPSANPIQIARVLGDGSTKLSQYEYNGIGKLTRSTDPVGRVMSYDYDPGNNIDLLALRQTTGSNNELLRTLTYNSQHEPLTDKDAAGQTTTYTYNSSGQILTVQNAKGETTTYSYGDGTAGHPIGYLASIASPPFNNVSAVTTFSYDSVNRARTVTDSDGYTVTTDYDNLDRKITVTYPDTTYEQFQYTDNNTGVMTLDLTGSRDRRGLWTYRHYNANRRMDSITDPANRTTNYGWCTCGALESIVDPKGQTTTFNRDLQGRVYQKVFADNTTVNYLYDGQTAANTAGASSRLKSSTDAKNQRTNYFYFADDSIQQITYTNTSGQPLTPPTPSANYTYDPNYNRVATMVDGTGTTTYSYNPIAVPPALGAGQLVSIDAPLANDTIVYTYDALGRPLSASVNGVAASQTYDTLGRIGTTTNPLGVFTNAYVNSVSARLQSTTVPSGPSVTYSYFPNSADKRLQTIQSNTSGGTLLSRFDYVYDADGEIATLTRKLGPTGFSMVWNNLGNPMGDAADQLTNLTEQRAIDQFVAFSWNYDNAGNRTSDNGGAYAINSVNQITNSGYTYDNNGNLTADPFRTYEWDAANRLVAINYLAIPTARTEFTYDGLSRRVKIVEKGLPAPALSITVQPPNSSYGTYTTSSVSLTAGTYTLRLEGLNPNGGDNTALVDAVKLNTTLVTNGGFETPALSNGSYVFNPTGATWTFTGTTGIAKNKSAFTNSNPNAPEGKQVGIVQMTGSMSQPRTLTAGTYNLNLRAAQRGSGNATFQQVKASLQSTSVVVLSTKQFIWNGNSIAEERDANNVATRRFYPQGEQISGASYYYARDHLGSVRELTDSTGAVRARYDYDPYGVRTKLSGDLDAGFGYTAHYYHQPSGLNLAVYRAYDGGNGRWLSRDPIGERAGTNLYEYVNNDPVRWTDPLGLYVPPPPPVISPFILPVIGVAVGLDIGNIPIVRDSLDTLFTNTVFRQPDQNPSPTRPRRQSCQQRESCQLYDEKYLGPGFGWVCYYDCPTQGKIPYFSGEMPCPERIFVP